MAKEMTAEQRQALRQANEARNAARRERKHGALVYHGYRIFQFDEQNVVVSKSQNESDYGYYPTVADAMYAVCTKVGGQKALEGVEIKQAMRGVAEDLKRSFSASLFL